MIRTVIAAENAVSQNLQLSARLLGQLINISEHRQSLLISPDYVALRSALVIALKPFPEAAAAVAQALSRLEATAAEEITRATQPAPKVIDVTPALPPPPPPSWPPPPPC